MLGTEQDKQGKDLQGFTDLHRQLPSRDWVKRSKTTPEIQKARKQKTDIPQ